MPSRRKYNNSGKTMIAPLKASAFPRRAIVLAFLLALVSITLVSVLTGCDSTPEKPVYDNPFDPNGPNGGDPYDLTATLGDTTITLSWIQPQGFGITNFDVLHSTSLVEEFFSIGVVDVTDEDRGIFAYVNPEPTTTHYFKIQAIDDLGNISGVSYIVPASAQVLARVVIGNGNKLAVTRNTSLNITVTDGDSLRISQTGHEDSELVMAADVSGTPSIVPWDLGSADSNDTILTMNVVVQFGNNLGDTNKVELELDFTPRLALAQGGIRVASLIPALTIEPEGLVFMRFASALEDLADLPWLPGSSTYDEYHLVDTANPQTIYAEFLGDFGFSNFQQLIVRPDLLLDPTFALVLPPNHISDDITIKGISNANATLMRFGESLDFSSIPWIAYSDTTFITLTPEPGEKVIYAQYRNDFADSPILTDYVIHINQPVDVVITAPAEGNLVNGGTFLLVQGTSTSPSGSIPVDLVKFDGGDGFVDVEGTDNWSFNWEIPRFDLDTDLTIRARAWAGDDSVTTSMSLIVTQLMLGITSPDEGDTVISDTVVEISGFALAATGGPALDSVVVTIDGVEMIAEGTGAWTVDWHPAEVIDEREVEVLATVYAGTTNYTITTTLLLIP